ncbi:MAG TPA: BON domain-containing protein [Kofleriaceae bacterium]|nr:BON domain-containing protein [Kofleriaceae bacterium]
MANHNLPEHRRGERPEEPEPSWRPQDREPSDEPYRVAGDDRGDPGAWGGEPRDARWWESDEDREVSDRSPGSGWSEPAADRRGASDRGRDPGYGEQRLRELQRSRRPDERPTPGSFEDRYRELGPEAGVGPWPDPTSRDSWHYASGHGHRGRDFERERHQLSGIREQRTGYQRGDERIGEPAGSYGRPGAWDSEEAARGADREHLHRGSGPHRGKGPASYRRSDDRIRELVCESLTDDDEIDASDIAVSVTGGEVTLSGTVDDRHAKRAAEDCAYSVTGVRDVQNRLRVRDAGASQGNPSRDAAVCLDESSASGEPHRA